MYQNFLKSKDTENLEQLNSLQKTLNTLKKSSEMKPITLDPKHLINKTQKKQTLGFA